MFFCFRQKTACEMRISDWSSVVCSSDLAVFVAEHGGFRQQAVDHLVIGGLVVDVVERDVALFGLLVVPDRVTLAEGAATRILARQADAEALEPIGRASRRGSVCQDV